MKFKIAKTIDDINICYKLRKIIFVEGQNVPIEEELDDNDNIAVHFLLLNNSDFPIGVGRVFIDEGIAIVGRFGILEEFRKKGAGLLLMQNIIEYCKKQGFNKIILGAQEHAINFYKKSGFEVISEKYMDANIPHFKMQLNV